MYQPELPAGRRRVYVEIASSGRHSDVIKTTEGFEAHAYTRKSRHSYHIAVGREELFVS